MNIKKILVILTIISLLIGCDNKVAVNSNPPYETKVRATSDFKATEDNEKASVNVIENKEEARDKEDTIIEVPKKVIVLDPGHAKGGNSGMEKSSPYSDDLKIKDPGGASGVSTRLNEYEINMIVAKKLKGLLEEEGFNVIMTKDSHEENPGNVDRAKIGNDNNASIVLRIHCDSYDSSSAQGVSMLVPKSVGYAENIYKVSEQYGEIILSNFVNATGAKNRGISKREDMTGFNWSKVPVVLVEMGFMSNSREDRLLASDNYQNKIAKGLLNGIKEVFH